jgi:hypothetical protein
MQVAEHGSSPLTCHSMADLLDRTMDIVDDAAHQQEVQAFLDELKPWLHPSDCPAPHPESTVFSSIEMDPIPRWYPLTLRRRDWHGLFSCRYNNCSVQQDSGGARCAARYRHGQKGGARRSWDGCIGTASDVSANGTAVAEASATVTPSRPARALRDRAGYRQGCAERLVGPATRRESTDWLCSSPCRTDSPGRLGGCKS